MNITHEHQQLFDTTKDFVENEINPNIEAWEKDGSTTASSIRVTPVACWA